MSTKIFTRLVTGNLHRNLVYKTEEMIPLRKFDIIEVHN